MGVKPYGFSLVVVQVYTKTNKIIANFINYYVPPTIVTIDPPSLKIIYLYDKVILHPYKTQQLQFIYSFIIMKNK